VIDQHPFSVSLAAMMSIQQPSNLIATLQALLEAAAA